MAREIDDANEQRGNVMRCSKIIIDRCRVHEAESYGGANYLASHRNAVDVADAVLFHPHAIAMALLAFVRLRIARTLRTNGGSGVQANTPSVPLTYSAVGSVRPNCGAPCRSAALAELAELAWPNDFLE